MIAYVVRARCSRYHFLVDGVLTVGQSTPTRQSQGLELIEMVATGYIISMHLT